jgi:hypothetical protein
MISFFFKFKQTKLKQDFEGSIRIFKINIIYKCKTILKEILLKLKNVSQIKFNISLQNVFAWIDI